MADDKCKLNEDLIKKLDHLTLMFEQPSLFLNEHFASIRNEIDIEAERLLQHIQERQVKAHSKRDVNSICNDSDSDEENKYDETSYLDQIASSINEKRSELLSILEQIEQEGISSKETVDKSAFVVALKQRVDAFIASKDYQDLNQIEETYANLAVDIINATNEQEKNLLDKKCCVYVPSGKKKYIGYLVLPGDDYMNRDELGCLIKLKYKSKSFNPEDIHREVQRSFSDQLALGVCRPFVLTKNTITVFAHLRQLNSLIYSNVYRVILRSQSESTDESNNEDNMFYPGLTKEAAEFFEKKLSNRMIDGVDILEMPDCLSTIDKLEIDFSNNRLRFFKLGESLLSKISSLDLSCNLLETLDDDLLAKCTNLTELHLTSSCLPGAKYSVNFLSHIPGLVELSLTLPDAPVDFAVFSNLSELEVLKLYGASSMDFNLAHLKLTRDACRQLAASPNLKRLELTHFEIESIDSETFGELKSLEMFALRSIRIGEIIDGAFEKMARSFLSSTSSSLRLENIGIQNLTSGMLRGLRNLQTLNLSNNDIEELPEGIFNNLQHLKSLDLSFNRIRFIKCGIFDGLTTLSALILNQNPIESIEANAFGGLFFLEDLYLISCKLRCVNNIMFNGLPHLKRLFLVNNQIEWFEVITDSGTLSLDGFLTEKEYEVVNQNLFCDLKYLEMLFLGRNKLKKMDLNVFGNLVRLRHLDLTDNMITELNSEAFDLNLSNLEVLTLERNHLKTIENGAFSYSGGLLMLNLSNNKLERLDDDFFKPFEQLETLHLQNNNLSIYITKDTFSNCYTIKEVNMLDNKSIRVELGAFRGLRRFHTLHTDLTEAFVREASPDDDEYSDESPNDSDDEENTNDSLSSSSRDSDSTSSSFSIYGTLKKPRTLVLGSSNFESLGMFLSCDENASFCRNVRKVGLVNCSLENLDDYKLNDNITQLVLNKNRLKSVELEWMKDLKELQDLDLSGNLIETLQDPNLFKNNLELSKLNLRGNKLNQIHRKLFKDLYKLESLDLSNNSTLVTIDCGMFRGLFSLKQLNMSGNNLRFFDLFCLFHACRSLESLDLSNNQLDNESVNQASMNGSTAQNLKELMLANNRLGRMDFVRDLYRLEKLDLSGNKIESISWNGVNVLGKLTNLKIFNLSSNQVKSLDESVISFLNQQKVFFELSDNPIGDISQLNTLKMVKY